MSTGYFFVTPFNYSARYPAGYRIAGQTGYPVKQKAGYPANSVSGATLDSEVSVSVTLLNCNI